jgi:hypothetical protein
MGESVLRSIQDVAAGRVPQNVVNRDAVETPPVEQKLRRYRAGTEQG